MASFIALGIMSGTSVDGLDLVLAGFTERGEKWNFSILKAEAVDYPEEIRSRLIDCIHADGYSLTSLDIQLGQFIGGTAMDFLKGTSRRPLFIASHGHTVYHQPDAGITWQIGDGEAIHQLTDLPVINDFRKLDVLRGGQGAPLVPVGDKLLFGEYEFCLNLGGFSNVSFDDNMGVRKAYDISPANIILNYLTRKQAHDYDPGGSIARKGRIREELLERLNALDFYAQQPPKSLGLEWVKKEIIPTLDKELDEGISIEDLLRTCTEHIALVITDSIKKEVERQNLDRVAKVLITGGGAWNTLLIERMRDLGNEMDLLIPDRAIVDFKEALIFAFMGLLRWRGDSNIWSSVTGASRDSCSGVIHGRQHPAQD